MLMDKCGVPLSWPTLYSTVRLRNAGLAFNSIKNKLNELKVLLRWEEAYGRNLEREFHAGNFLSVADIVSVRDFSALKVLAGEKSSARVRTFARSSEADLAPVKSARTVSKQVHYNRLTTIADYIEFLAQAVTSRSSNPSAAGLVDQMAKGLRNHRPRGMSTYQDDDPVSRSPRSDVAEAFVLVGSEGHLENPFRSGSIQRRNELIFRLLYETGIRLGELLSLRLDCIDLGREPWITIRRTHDDEYDPRDYQPVAKTKERVLPIGVDLAARIHRYCMEDRAKTRGANRHPYLFVTHRKGATHGKPLSISTVGSKVFGRMQEVRTEFAEIHPHSFRHHMNYIVSKRVDEFNKRAKDAGSLDNELISEGRELDIRAHLNGHRSSKSGEVYNRRHVRERSDEVVRDIQRHLIDSLKSFEDSHGE